MEERKHPTIRELYPNLSDEELRQAEDNLDRYFELVLRIFERTEGRNSD